MGIPLLMRNYIIHTYERGTTKLCCLEWKSVEIHPNCGVKQEDPMSPVIYNMVMDRLLTRLPKEVGAKSGGLTVNAAAFADDMLLFATTPLGLQKLLDVSSEFLDACGF